MTIANPEQNLLAASPAVGSVWVQHYPERWAGTRMQVTAVKIEAGKVLVESEEIGFPGGRAWLDLAAWLDIYSPAS
jgi:hypothetical protein